MSDVYFSKTPTSSARWFRLPSGSMESSRVMLRGGVFRISEFPGGKPMDFDAASELLKNFILIDGKNFNDTLMYIGEQIKEEWISMLEGGMDSEIPLSDNTKKARRVDGHRPTPFLFETGALVKNTKVVLRGTGGGHAGIAIVPGSGKGSHGAVSQWSLLSTLAREGMAIYRGQLSNESIRHMMAWRDKHFDNPKPKKAKGGMDKGDNVFDLYMTPSHAEELYGSEGPARFGFKKDKGSWVETAERSKYRLAGDQENKKSGKGPIINIPPRPLFSKTMEEKLAERATAILRDVFETDAIITAKAFGSSPATTGAIASHKAKMHKRVK